MKLKASKRLAENLKFLRSKRGLSQQQLSELSEIPRSTLAHLESGGANPTLDVLSKLSSSLQVSLEELLTQARSANKLFRGSDLKTLKREGGWIRKLLPESIPGMEIDHMKLNANASIRGIPHRPGTREYLCCDSGKMEVWVQGESYLLQPGDVLAFDGSSRHSYRNLSSSTSKAFSVVTLGPVQS